jgi:hypothetical protein
VNTIDGLLQMCLASPADADRRGILCDALAEDSETELEAALRSADGEQIIRRVYQLADMLKRSACLRLLWCVAMVERKVFDAYTSPKMTKEQIDELMRSLHVGRNAYATYPSSPGFNWETATPDFTYRSSRTPPPESK